MVAVGEPYFNGAHENNINKLALLPYLKYILLIHIIMLYSMIIDSLQSLVILILKIGNVFSEGVYSVIAIDVVWIIIYILL